MVDHVEIIIMEQSVEWKWMAPMVWLLVVVMGYDVPVGVVVFLILVGIQSP